MTVKELAERLRGDQPPTVVDVREAEELETSKLDMFIHIPIGEIAMRHAELEGQADIAVICRIGHRSARVVEYLRGLGYQHVENVEGGINAWAEEIDPTMSTY